MSEENLMPKLYLPQSMRRLAAFGADEICIGLLFLPLWRLVWDTFTTEDDIFISIPIMFFILLFPALYQFVFLTFFSRTPGKWLFNLWVVSAHDPEVRITWVQALLRAMTGRLTLFFSWAIYVVAFFRYDRTHLGDWMAETRVMQEAVTPRRIRLHPWIGGVLLLFFVSEGFSNAMMMWESIDWKSNRVELHDFMASSWSPDMIFDSTDEDTD